MATVVLSGRKYKDYSCDTSKLVNLRYTKDANLMPYVMRTHDVPSGNTSQDHFVFSARYLVSQAKQDRREKIAKSKAVSNMLAEMAADVGRTVVDAVMADDDDVVDQPTQVDDGDSSSEHLTQRPVDGKRRERPSPPPEKAVDVEEPPVKCRTP